MNFLVPGVTAQPFPYYFANAAAYRDVLTGGLIFGKYSFVNPMKSNVGCTAITFSGGQART